ncbi:hypothetical protein JB92DRAFT_3107744 [Gautieria morchelliformis]|nr:hypothetical protein JB92DRAFT_3107744 [Gautieria morchelliformis]
MIPFEVTKYVARGALSKKIEVDVKGQILELKETVNGMTESLGVFVDKVTRWGGTKYGRREDLEEAVSLDREALLLQPAPHPERSSSLNHIAIALWTRFNKYGRREDLEQAI